MLVSRRVRDYSGMMVVDNPSITACESNPYEPTATGRLSEVDYLGDVGGKRSLGLVSVQVEMVLLMVQKSQTTTVWMYKTKPPPKKRLG